MAHWRKVIVSGSNSELNHITSSGDLFLSTDGSQMKFGADEEVTLTHVHNEGLLLSDASGIGTTKLQFGDSATFVQQQADGELGIDADVKVDITTPVVSMSADLFVSGSVHAEGNITFKSGDAGTIQLGDNANDNISAQGDFISSLIPNAGDSFNLGSNTQRWNDLYLSGSIVANGGPHNIDSATTIDIDSVGATSIDAGAASNLSTSAGDLTLEAGATDAKVVIKGDHESGTSIHLDGNQAAASVVDIDAGALDIDAAATIHINTSGGAGAGNIDIQTADTTNGVKIATVTSGVPVTIGTAASVTRINGDLDVDGTLTTIDTTNLQIKDKFIQVASGSQDASTNGGLIVTTTGDGSGSALYYEGDRQRWALTKPGDTGHTDTAATHRQFVVSVSQSAAPPNGNPSDFGSSNEGRRGMMYVQTSDDPANSNNVEGDIWIWS